MKTKNKARTNVLNFILKRIQATIPTCSLKLQPPDLLTQLAFCLFQVLLNQFLFCFDYFFTADFLLFVFKVTSLILAFLQSVGLAKTNIIVVI